MFDEKQLRLSLIRRAHQLRLNTFKWDNLRTAQSVGYDIVTTKLGTKNRCRVILTAHGCSVGTCTMCPLPDEAVPENIAIETADWMAQIEKALDTHKPIDILTLYHNGNFFSDKEVPPERRDAIYKRLAKSSITQLVVESLPQFITAERISHAVNALREDQRVEVAIGLQSMDPFLRETVLTSPCREPAMKEALKTLRSANYEAQVFLMYQMPFLTTEESMLALETSVLELQTKYHIDDPTICALRIAPATVVGDLHSRGELRLGSLWGLVEVLKTIREKSPTNRARVATSLLAQSTDKSPTTDACERCRAVLLPWIDQYNKGLAVPVGSADMCGTCRDAALAGGRAYVKMDVLKRIADYLSQQCGAAKS